MSAPMVPCERCHGTGHRRLNAKEREVLAMVGSEWAATGDIAPPEATIKRPALLYRLAKLEALGFVERRRLADTDELIAVGHGGEYQWRRK